MLDDGLGYRRGGLGGAMRLEVLDFDSPTKWRFRLTDPAGGFLADHCVELDAGDWELEAFTDLRNYLRWNAATDRWLAHEAELVAQLGDWIAAQVLGEVAPKLAEQRGAVRLELPPEAAVLGYLPWELARVNGRTLAEQRVSVIIDQLPPPDQRRLEVKKGPVGEHLRMLAVFSLPDGTGALNLRRERHELTELVRRIAKVNNKAIELRVLQYGVTRERLADALLEQPGWDVVHLSGHGLAGGLVLENDTGGHDLITSGELVDLLDYGSDQIKLVVLSACESAAVTAREHLRLLNLAPPTREDTDTTAVDAGEAGPVLPAVAAEIVRRLDCAVLAMRYPVVDDFAIALASSFYDLTLGMRQPVARALGLSLSQSKVAPTPPTPGAPALSVGTPVLVGKRAEGLTLVPPPTTGQPVLSIQGQRLAGFPDQPERFVGRVGAMTRAATALAPQSGRSGVLLHGMAGAGKTTCAIELAYTHQESFPAGMAWYTAPPLGADITSALTDFALSLEHQLDLQFVHLVTNTTTLRPALPKLTQLLEEDRVLVVVDNVESLLTETGAWRDERWGMVIAAMTAHRGLSRLVLTSRTPIAGLDPSVLVEPVHGLSLQEAVLLARELPNLGGLIDARALPTGFDAGQARELVARVLAVVQGHPKLIELADGQATNPTQLQQRLNEADQTWLQRGTRLEPFLAGRDPAPTDTDYLAVLQGWTRATATTLPDHTTLLLQVLCCAEDDDRIPPVLNSNWGDIWRRLDRPGDPPELEPLLAELAARALLDPHIDPTTGAVTGWRIHPGVADTIRTTTSATTAAAVDTELGDSWLATLNHARRDEHTDQMGWLVLRAARCAAPYLLRQHRWAELGHAAQTLLARDRSTATAAALLPMLHTALTTTGDDDPDLTLSVGRTHARAVIRLDPAQGETQMRNLLHTATTTHHWEHARLLTGDLISHLRDRGQFREALALAETLPDYTRRAGYGPWTQLADQGRRLQVQYLLGEQQLVLDQVLELRQQMTALPDPPEPTDTSIAIWNVRETLLQTGVIAALGLDDWQQVLDLNADIQASQRRRGASLDDQANTRFADYGPLLNTGRINEARTLLINCLEVFRINNNITRIGRTLGALAEVEAQLGHPTRAINLQTDALRYTYLAGDPSIMAISHNNLAGYLQHADGDPQLVWAHHLAAAIIRYQTGDGNLPFTLRNIARLLYANPDTQPTTFTDICALVDQTDGVHLAQLLDQLPHHAPDPHTALTHILQLAHQTPTDTEPDQTAVGAAFADALVAAAQGDTEARELVEPLLEQVATDSAFATMAAVLQMVIAGERNPSVDHLDPDAAEVVNAVLARLATTPPPDAVAGSDPVEKS